MSDRMMAYGAVAPSGAAAAAPALRPTGFAAPVAALVELGVLDELAGARATAEDISRAHPVWRVRLGDGRRLVVKAGLGHGGPDLAVECLVYRMTWWCESLAAALPTPLAVDEDRQVLVLADVGDAAGSGSLAQRVGWSALLTGTPAPTPLTIGADTWAKLGRTVGALHRATAGYPLPPAPPPLVLSVVGRSTTDLAGARLSEEVAETVRRLSDLPTVEAAADELRRPVNGCLVNHDLKWDNVVLDERDPSRGRVPVLLDWELAGLGDPAWDLGCLLAEHLLRTPSATLDSAARTLLAGYGEGARPRPEVAGSLARRVVLSAGLRIAQLALEVAWTPYSGDAGAIDRLIDRARLVLDTPTLIDEVRPCLTCC